MSTSPASGTSTAPPAPPGEPRTPRPGLALAVILACQLMVVLDATIVNIALPDMRRALGFSPTGLTWIVNAYTLAFGGLLLLGGRAGDILGRRRVFLAGIALFTVASLVGGFADSAGMLLAARAVQGVGAAFAAPGTLALLNTNFEGPARARALGIYSAVSGAGLAFGLVCGGLLTDTTSWRAVLFVNVPIGIAILVLAPRHIRQPERHPGRFDVPGALTSTAGMVLLVYGCIRAAAHGWGDGITLGALASAGALLGAFVAIETRAVQPITPLRLLAHRNRAGAYLNMLLLPATMFAMFFFLTQFLQNVLNLSPFEAGCAFLPMALCQFACARATPVLLPRFGAKPILVLGGVLVAAGILWLTRIDDTAGYAGAVLGPMILFGIGSGLSFMPLNLIILSEVPAADAGAASGLLQALQQVGASLGLAILAAVSNAASRDAAKHPPTGANPEQSARHALTEGIAGATVGAAVFALCALAVSVLVIRPARPSAERPT
ncbi:MFS transporter [Embleya sp. NPDC050493]|uniref:MFS transporter n=1 Tax=Embleya sp. NPDC050493 TaxID=3363989 RepID=UPI003792E232